MAERGRPRAGVCLLDCRVEDRVVTLARRLPIIGKPRCGVWRSAGALEREYAYSTAGWRTELYVLKRESGATGRRVCRLPHAIVYNAKQQQMTALDRQGRDKAGGSYRCSTLCVNIPG